jgi:hypothetical protein
MRTKKQGQWLWAQAGMVAAAMLAQGCGTAAVMRPADRTGDSESVAATTAEEHARLLNLRIDARGSGAHDKTVAGLVGRSVSGSLLRQGYRMEDGTADVLVSLTAEAKVFDKSGNYYRHDGTLDAEVSLPPARRKIGRQSFTARGDRKLGETESLRDLAARLAEPAEEWVRTLAGPLGSELAVNDVVVRRSRLNAVKTPDSRYAERFVKRVSELDGVISCELVGQDRVAHGMTFRIVYYRQKFPAGMLNRLANMSGLEL